MHEKFVFPLTSKCVDTLICPYIRSRPTMASELDVVDMRTRTLETNKNELMQATIKSSLHCICLAPLTNNFELSIVFSACSHHLQNLPPVHENLMHGAI